MTFIPCATLALSRLLAHLKAHGIDPSLIEVRTDLGTEFKGDTIHYRPDGFHGSILVSGARHRLNPPARPNANADVESSHATIGNEFFDLESFLGPRHFIASVTTYQHFFNFARKNRSPPKPRFNSSQKTPLISTLASSSCLRSSSSLFRGKICLALPSVAGVRFPSPLLRGGRGE